MTQETSQKMSDEKMSLPSTDDAQKMAVDAPVTPEKMSLDLAEHSEENAAAQPDEPGKPTFSGDENDIFSVAENVAAPPQKMSLEDVTGPLDLNAMQDYWLILKDGREVPVMGEPAVFDRALQDIGFNLIDRATWPIYHRLLVLEQAPRGPKGVRIVRKKMSVDVQKMSV